MQDVKISGKQWRGYFEMHREPFGPSANDGYNVQTYGITGVQYRALLRIAENAAGSDAKQVTRAQILKLMRGERVMLSRAAPDEIERVRQAFA